MAETEKLPCGHSVTDVHSADEGTNHCYTCVVVDTWTRRWLEFWVREIYDDPGSCVETRGELEILIDEMQRIARHLHMDWSDLVEKNSSAFERQRVDSWIKEAKAPGVDS